MNPRTGWMRVLLILAVGALVLAFTVSMSAQVQTTKKTAPQGQATTSSKTLSGEIVYVNGRDLVIKMDDGTLRHFNNVPDTAKAMVDGKEMTIKDAKVGMKLQKTITTVTTPKVITTTQSVTGTVWNVMPPSSVILTLEDGKNQQFKVPKGQKFNIDGKETDVWGLKKGMKVTATKVVEQPIEVITQQAKVTGQAPPPPPAPPADQPILVAVIEEVPVATPAAEKAPAALPKTGSEMMLFGLLGTLSLAGAAGLRAFRRFLG